MNNKLTYEAVYTPSLGGRNTHPYWYYERGYWLDCKCPECCQLRVDDPTETALARHRQEASK